MVKRGEFIGQREGIYKGNEKQHVLAFLEERVAFEGGCGLRLEKWTVTKYGRVLFIQPRSLEFILYPIGTY